MTNAAEMVASLEKRIAESVDSVSSITLSDGRRMQDHSLASWRAELEWWRNQLAAENRGKGTPFPMVRVVFKSDG